MAIYVCTKRISPYCSKSETRPPYKSSSRYTMTCQACRAADVKLACVAATEASVQLTVEVRRTRLTKFKM